MDSQAVRNELWRRGELKFLLGARPIEPPRVGVESLRSIYDWLKVKWGSGPTLVLLCHRRTGKTSLGLMMAIELAIKFPRSRIAVIATTKEAARDLAAQIMPPLLDTCPRLLKPTWHATQVRWIFPNGSQIEFFGNEPAQTARMRGGKFRAIIAEEARDLPYLKEAAESVWKPALADTMGSQLLLISTAPEEEESSYEEYYRAADSSGNAYTLRLSENPDYPDSYREAVVRETLGGREGAVYQREQECHFIANDDHRLVIPEFTPQARKEIVHPITWGLTWPWIVGLDPGGADATGVVWCCIDEKQQTFNVVRELRIHESVSTSTMAAKIREVEAQLWGGYVQPPNLRRYCDPTSLQVITNLAQEENLRFQASDNKDLRGKLDLLRRAVQDRSLHISPDCKWLIQELALSQWDGTKLKRSKKTGHADVLMALKYSFQHTDLRPGPRSNLQRDFPIPGMEGGIELTNAQKVTRFLTNPLGARWGLPGLPKWWR